MRKIALLLISAAIPMAWSQTGHRPEILVLGTFHMSNPGRDVVNLKADDMLAPKRQEEMAAFAEVLKKFRPTKIAIEQSVGNTAIDGLYADYLANKFKLGHNEIYQVGFRLAKEMGHKAIFSVDEDGDFPWGRLNDYAKANGQADKLQASTDSLTKDVKEDNDYLLSHTVLEMMLRINSDDHSARGVAQYFDYVRLSQPNDYAGPDLIASWYQRNIRIYSNIIKLIDSPDERILVIYGAGHLGWLRQMVSSDANVRLRELAEFVGNP